MRSNNVVKSLLAAALVVGTVVGCSAKEAPQKAAAGTAKPTTKKPPSTPAPTTKTGSTASANTASAADAEATCESSEEGLGACVDTFVVFCSGQKLYAIDCAESFGGTCSDAGGVVDCYVETVSEE